MTFCALWKVDSEREEGEEGDEKKGIEVEMGMRERLEEI